MSEQRRAVIAGATGFIGRTLAEALRADGWDVRTIGRSAEITWSDPGRSPGPSTARDVLVNLAGKSVDCRYNDANRDEILALARRDDAAAPAGGRRMPRPRRPSG